MCSDNTGKASDRRDLILVNGILAFREEMDVPWRHEKDPLRVLVGEILLIRTKVKQAVRVYREFFDAFPDGKIPRNRREFALEILKKAGLFHRARGIVKLLDILAEKYALPNDPDELKGLPYVSDYIVSALRYFIDGHASPLIDSNVIRFLNRYYGHKKSKGTHPSVFHKQKMEQLIALAKPLERKLILKTLDFSILVCSPKPKCKVCPLSESCNFLRSRC